MTITANNSFERVFTNDLGVQHKNWIAFHSEKGHTGKILAALFFGTILLFSGLCYLAYDAYQTNKKNERERFSVLAKEYAAEVARARDPIQKAAIKADLLFDRVIALTKNIDSKKDLKNAFETAKKLISQEIRNKENLKANVLSQIEKSFYDKINQAKVRSLILDDQGKSKIHLFIKDGLSHTDALFQKLVKQGYFPSVKESRRAVATCLVERELARDMQALGFIHARAEIVVNDAAFSQDADESAVDLHFENICKKALGEPSDRESREVIKAAKRELDSALSNLGVKKTIRARALKEFQERLSRAAAFHIIKNAKEHPGDFSKCLLEPKAILPERYQQFIQRGIFTSANDAKKTIAMVFAERAILRQMAKDHQPVHNLRLNLGTFLLQNADEYALSLATLKPQILKAAPPSSKPAVKPEMPMSILDKFSYISPEKAIWLAEAELGNFFHHTKPPTLPRVHPAPRNLQEHLSRLLRNAPGFCLGESHNERAAKLLLERNMRLLKENGVNSFFVEGTFLKDWRRIKLFNEGKSNDVSWAFPDDRETILIARQHGISIYPIESCERAYPYSYERLLALNHPAYKLIQEMRKRTPNMGKFVLWVGARHTNTFREGNKVAPGLAELLNIPTVLAHDSSHGPPRCKENADHRYLYGTKVNLRVDL